DRIVTASIHRDEATPHLSAFVVPLTQDGRLSAKEFIGGRDKMRADQTSFAEAVRALGLERGIEGSRATHQRVQSYYGAIERQPGHAT
ncbi:plasmid recombination enzyme, partial [Acinetobacter baumannii]|nr:plasmid recombination enzyme [Acinetobacter baumannii]